MIKHGDWLYCHTSLVFEDKSISFTKGQSYMVEQVTDDKEVILIDNQGHEHTMGKLEGIIDSSDWRNDNISYKTWFSCREEKLKLLLDD